MQSRINSGQIIDAPEECKKVAFMLEDKTELMIGSIIANNILDNYKRAKEDGTLEKLPKGLVYYGVGHLHRGKESKQDGKGIIVYPGPLFGSTLTHKAKGEDSIL